MLTPSREGSAEPVGGVSRFQSVVNYYRSNAQFAGQPDPLTFFSGDAFNPSLESTVTKGRHMVPFLNKAGTDVACIGVGDPIDTEGDVPGINGGLTAAESRSRFWRCTAAPPA